MAAQTEAVAFRPPGTLTFPVGLIPSRFTLENVWTVLFTERGIGVRPYLNVALYGVSSARLTAVISALGGHALARYELRWGRPLLLLFLALNFLPAAARLVPLFLLPVRLDLYDRAPGGGVLEVQTFPTKFPHIVVERADLFRDGSVEADEITWTLYRVQNQRRQTQLNRVLDATNLLFEFVRLVR
jgi:hypothetical protein